MNEQRFEPKFSLTWTGMWKSLHINFVEFLWISPTFFVLTLFHIRVQSFCAFFCSLLSWILIFHQCIDLLVHFTQFITFPDQHKYASVMHSYPFTFRCTDTSALFVRNVWKPCKHGDPFWQCGGPPKGNRTFIPCYLLVGPLSERGPVFLLS